MEKVDFEQLENLTYYLKELAIELEKNYELKRRIEESLDYIEDLEELNTRVIQFLNKNNVNNTNN